MSFAAAVRVQRLSRSYFVWISLGAIALVFAGFARTYYLHGLFGQPALPLLLHVHGAVMSAWFALLALQSGLIAMGQRRLHRTLGWAGGGRAVLIVLLGTFVAVHAAIRDLPHPELGSIFFLGADGTMLLLFAGFFAASVLLRKRSHLHKRLVLLATLCILPAALGRLPGLRSIEGAVLATGLAAIIFIGIDTWRSRRLHPVFGWGAPLALAALYFAFKGAQSQAWTAFATRLLS
jgi:hypothetical protein